MSSATPASTKTSTSPIFWQVMPIAPARIWSFPMAGILWVLMCGRLPMPCLERCACTRRILSSMMPRSIVTAGVSRSPMTVIRKAPSRDGFSARRVAAARHACAKRALVVRAPVGQRALLLRHVSLLLRLHLLSLLLLLFFRPHPPYPAEEHADPGPDGSALSRVAPDCAADSAEGRAAEGSPKEPALRRLRLAELLRRRGRRSHPRIRRIETRLPDGPRVALALVRLLLLRGLAFGGIEVCLGRGRRGRERCESRRRHRHGWRRRLIRRFHAPGRELPLPCAPGENQCRDGSHACVPGRHHGTSPTAIRTARRRRTPRRRRRRCPTSCPSPRE